MKTVTAIAAAALLFGVTAASAQAPSSGASQPGATTNTDKEVPAVGTKGNEASKTGEAAPNKPMTTGSGSGHGHDGRLESEPGLEQEPGPGSAGQEAVTRVSVI